MMGFEDDGFDGHCPHCGAGFYATIGPPGRSQCSSCGKALSTQDEDEDEDREPISDEEVKKILRRLPFRHND